MPPRKRAETKPETPEAAPGADETPELELPPDAPDAPDAGSADGASPEASADDSPDETQPPADDTNPSSGGPCPECFPNGWTEQATAVGCTHGNWTRDSK